MPTFLWVIIGAAIVAGLLTGGNGRSHKSKGSGGRPVRVDHPHYFEPDDHECSVCGARFRGKGMTCPKCGSRFAGTKEDDTEFIEEMVVWDDDDDD